jgi:hypothetical protein
LAFGRKAPAKSGFAKFGEADPATTKVYFNPGTYVCEVVEMAKIVSQNMRTKGRELLIVRLKVVEVLDRREGTGDFGPSNIVGSTPGTVFDSTFETEIERLKQLFVAIETSEDPEFRSDSVTPDEWNATLETALEPPGTEMAGKLVTAIAVGKYGKAKLSATGEPLPQSKFVQVNFEPAFGDE